MILKPAEAPSSTELCDIDLGPGRGWTMSRMGDLRIHFKGYLFDGPRTLESAAAAELALRLFPDAGNDAAVRVWLEHLAGHFALVLQAPRQVVASVDRVRSIPLLWARLPGRIGIDDSGQRLRDRFGGRQAALDPDNVLACAMSGYTVGAATIYRDLKQLRAGEALIVDRDGARTMRWFKYDAWNTEHVPQPQKKLSEVHRFIIERLAQSAAGRPIVVPLSAGYDSRMIAAGLREVGYPDVRLFSYGRADNHEVQTAKAVADRLSYPWTFVSFTDAKQRGMFADPEHQRDIWEEADTCGCVPFEQDYIAVAELKRSGWLPADALIVNGQSGDFITGNHVPAAFHSEAGRVANRDDILNLYTAKHYALWRAGASASNLERVGRLLAAELDAAEPGANPSPHGLFEFLEYQDRQAKYVISGQRTYEALGMAWRLPLWDDDCVLFWRRAPVELKARQALYREVLESDNWGDVWRDIPLNRKTIRPRWLIPLRLAAKTACAPFGRERWHRFERRVFGWWMDPNRTSAVIPYTRALADDRGPRHGMAWLVERYLAGHGIAIDDVLFSDRRAVA